MKQRIIIRIASSFLVVVMLCGMSGFSRASAEMSMQPQEKGYDSQKKADDEQKKNQQKKAGLTPEEVKKRREELKKSRSWKKFQDKTAKGQSDASKDRKSTQSSKESGTQTKSTSSQKSRPTKSIPAKGGVTKTQSKTRSGKVKTSGSGGIKLDYDNADLYDFINVVADILDINYLIDPAVQGKVTIKMTKSVSKDALFPIFIDILRINGITIVKSGDIYHIVPIDDGQKYPSETIQKIHADFQITGSDLSTFVIPIEFMPSGDLAKVLEQFQTEKTQIINLESHNVLLVTDFKDNQKKLLNIIKILDSGFFEVNRVELVQIKFNKAEEVVKDLEAVFGVGGTNSGVKFIPIERLNAILAVCRSGDVLEKVYEWVEKLDRQAVHGVETFVYKVENTTAANIAEILSQLFADQGAQTSSVGGGAQGIATGERGTSSLPPQQASGGSNISTELRGVLQRTGTGPIQGLSGNVKIIVDELNNNIIIQGTPADYEFLLKTIKKLDVLPRQVLIEAKIISVQITDNFSMGMQSILGARSDTYPPTTVQVLGSSGGEGSSSPVGITLSTIGIIGNRELSYLFQAIESQGNAQILNAPSVMVLDGNEASINVGTEIPIATSTFSNPYLSGGDETGTNLTNTQIQYRSTGITLNVAPRISAVGIVTMEVAAEVSTPGTSTEGLAGSPPINRAIVNSVMVVEDGSSLVIAGLIKEENTKSRTSLPILGRIPILGWLFSNTSTSKDRSELLIILTPHVVHTTDDARETTAAVTQSLKQINAFIEKKKKEGEFSIFEKSTAKKQEKIKTEIKESSDEKSQGEKNTDEKTKTQEKSKEE